MKKALITLLALTGMAMAANDEVLTLTSTSSTTETDNSTSYGLVFDINAGTDYRKSVSGTEDYSQYQDVILKSITLGIGAQISANTNIVLMGNLSADADTTTGTGDLLGFISSANIKQEGSTAVLDFSDQNITLTQNRHYRLFFTSADLSSTAVGSRVTVGGNGATATKATATLLGYTAGDTAQRTHLGFLGSGLGPGINQGWTPVVTMELTPVPSNGEDPGTLTQTAVAKGGVSVNGTNITLTVTDNLAGVTGGFNVTVGEEAWQAIVDGMEPSGGIYQNATVTLTGADGATLDLATYTGGAVTLNGYTGTGTQGEYFVAYIPEPATATLSLLALAALAARRRRK